MSSVRELSARRDIRSLIIIYLSGDRSNYTARDGPPCVLDNYSMHILTIRGRSGNPLNRPAAAALIVLQMYIAVADDNAIKSQRNVIAGEPKTKILFSPGG